MILFAKAPVPGRVKTRLGVDPERAAALHSAFVRGTLETLQCCAAELDVELSTDDPTDAWSEFSGPRSVQVSGNLGGRIFAALDGEPCLERLGAVQRVRRLRLPEPLQHVGVEAVSIAGLKRYPESLVRRYTRLEPGTPYELQKLLQVQRTLQNAPWFASVAVDIDPVSIL